jgi:hypothetical protein
LVFLFVCFVFFFFCFKSNLKASAALEVSTVYPKSRHVGLYFF